MHKHLTVTAFSLIASVAFDGCAQKQAESNPCPESGVRLFITSDGTVTLNGGTIEVGALHDALLALNPTPTVVCYSRDNATGEPPAAATQAMDAIIELQLPVALYTDSTFKTAVQTQ